MSITEVRVVIRVDHARIDVDYRGVTCSHELVRLPENQGGGVVGSCEIEDDDVWEAVDGLGADLAAFMNFMEQQKASNTDAEAHRADR